MFGENNRGLVNGYKFFTPYEFLTGKSVSLIGKI